MKNSVNNKIIEDVLASFKMDYIDVPEALLCNYSLSHPGSHSTSFRLL